MKKFAYLLSRTFLCLFLAQPFVAPVLGATVDLPRFPSISPDGKEIVFSWRGDLWKVGAEGGHAMRLTSHPQDDLASAWSACGEMIAFNSMRDGYLNIWLMNVQGAEIRQVTHTDRSCLLAGFGTDENGGAVITFSGYLEGDVHRSQRPYMTSLNGGDLIRMHEAFGSFPRVSPDGSRIAFTRGGRPSSWERRHYRGSDAKNVWVYNRSEETFTQVTAWAGNDGQAKWAGDGWLVYLSDRELDTMNLYRIKAGAEEGQAQRLTSFENRDVQHFDVSADGRKAVLMVWDTLYTLDVGEAAAGPVVLPITASDDNRDNYELRSVARSVSEAALSPDGKVMAYIAYGRVYVRNVEDKSPTRRVTGESHASHKDIAWSPDGEKLYFASDEDGTESIYAATVSHTRRELRKAFEEAMNRKDAKEDVEKEEPKEETSEEAARPGEDEEEEGNEKQDKDREKEDKKEGNEQEKGEEPSPGSDLWHDPVRFAIEPVVQGEFHDRMPSPSPDGRSLAFRRCRGELMILDLESGDVRHLGEGWDTQLHWRWSPDSRHIAYSQNNLDYSANIFIVPADGANPPVNITRHPRNDISPRWSADGRVLAFLSNRSETTYDVWMVSVDRELEALTPKELEDYYEEARKEAQKAKPLPVEEAGRKKLREKQEPVELHLEDAWLRLRRVTSFPASELQLELTPGGDRYIFTADIGGRALYSIKWDGSDRKRLTGNVNVQHVNLTGSRAVFVESGRAGTVPSGGGNVEYSDLSDRVRVDLQSQSSQKFREAARVLGERFYHNDLKGLDWDQLTQEYHELARQTRRADEFNHVANRFLGELNGSHLGVRANDPASPLQQPLGRLGTLHERVQLEDDGRSGFRITEVIPHSPADTGTMALAPGDIITAIEMEPFAAGETVERRLQGRVGEETIVTILRQLDRGEEVELHSLLTPISYGAEADLRYHAWRLRAAQRVAELSGGRIGYIHIQGMNQASLDVYERDLYAAATGKDGLIIDVRNNGGGWTTDRLLASIMVQSHAYTIPRGADVTAAGHYPQDRLFIPRYTLPINMLCNEKSFSNAEIISHAFKTLGRGTLVGQQTHGSVISTGSYSLIDGTTIRLPFRGWYLLDGTDMENNGAMPDLVVPQTPETETQDLDEQLVAAVEDLLERLPE
jgi:tricorn protease